MTIFSGWFASLFMFCCGYFKCITFRVGILPIVSVVTNNRELLFFGSCDFPGLQLDFLLAMTGSTLWSLVECPPAS